MKNQTFETISKLLFRVHEHASSYAQFISKGILSLLIVLFFSHCKETTQIDNPDTAASDKLSAKTSAAVGYDIMCTNNSNNKLELFNYGDADWNASGALKWSWMPSTALGYTSTEVGYWTNGDPEGDPMDAKRVITSVWPGVSEVLVTVGGQLATIARYVTTGTKGSKIWAINVGAGAYPHAAELIPNGNLAVAAAHGDWVRVYNTNGTNYANFPLVGAHGVVWDPVIHRLWVVGDTKLTALIVGGGRGTPTLTEDVARTKTIPGNGHDLSVYEGDNNKLWVTNSNNVYIYDKTTKVLTNAPGASFRTKVKAVSNNDSSSGYMIVQTRPTTACTLNTWCTPTVDFYNSSGTYLGSRTRTSAAYYKADVFSNNPVAAPAAPIANGKYKIINRNSSKVIAAASTASSAKLIQYYYSPTNPNDEWNITQIGTSGYYRITNVSSGLDANVQGATYSTADIIQYAYSSAAPNNDEWSIVDIGGGYYKIVSRYSNKVLNVEAASLVDGAQIIQWDYTNVPQSQWSFELIP